MPFDAELSKRKQHLPAAHVDMGPDSLIGREDQLADTLMTAAGYRTVVQEMAISGSADGCDAAVQLSSKAAGDLVQARYHCIYHQLHFEQGHLGLKSLLSQTLDTCCTPVVVLV